MKTEHHPPTARRRGRLGWLAALCAVAAGTVVAGAPAAPANAASEVINGPSTIELDYDQGFGNSGDLPMPSCGSQNITGDKGHAEWTITSSLGENSIVFPGTEWDVTVEMYADHLDYSPWNYNDGPDPLIVQMVPTGPVERVQIVPTLPANLGIHDAYHGDSPVGPKNAIQTWGYAFDSNSEPKLDGVHIETSDGVDLRLRIRMRALSPGVIALPKLQISGWDSTPKAASVSCEVPIGWTWGVTAYDPPIVKGEAVKTDASYAALDPEEADDANWGSHGIAINVLANDDDANTTGGIGDTDDVRIESWSLNSDEGGNVDCGGALSPFPEDEPFADLFTGPCTYLPPADFSGTDTFHYTVRQRSDGSTASGTVKVTVVPNPKPLTAEAEFYSAVDQDQTFDVSAYSVDPDEEPLTCLTDLVTPPAPAIGTVTMHPDCTFDWVTDGGQGSVDFTYRVCDTHALLASHGTAATKVQPYATGDLSPTTSRRCTDADVTIYVQPGIVIPPTGVPDIDKVDAGYPGDGIGAYSIVYPVFVNDIDLNGPDGESGLVGLAILTPPTADQGTAVVEGESIRFTPADGFSGPVAIKYRVCEDPDEQDPPYDGFGFCGAGILTINVVGNEAPVAVDDFAVAVAPTGVVVDRDLAANDVDPEEEGLACDQTLVNVDPAFIASATLGADCLLDVDPVDGVTGATSFGYRVCDAHALSLPKWPATPYGTDGRDPGDAAPRCDTAEVDLFIINPLVIDPEEVPEIEPGPEDQGVDPPPTEPPVDTTLPPDTTAPGVPVTPPTTDAMEVPNPGELPRTGGGSGGILLVGAVLLGLGALTVQVARRRRTV